MKYEETHFVIVFPKASQTLAPIYADTTTREEPDFAVQNFGLSSRQAIFVHCSIGTLIGQKGERKVEVVWN